jgi:hypothetical protein
VASIVMAWQMAIYERLRENLTATKVFLEGVPENSKVPHDPTGLIKPFVIVWFGQLTTSSTSDDEVVAGLCDEPDELDQEGKQGNLAIETVAPSGLSLLQLEDATRVLLTGFSPAGQGRLTEDGSASVRDPLPIGIGDQIRFYKTLFFRGDFVSTVGQELTAIPQAMRTHCPQGHPYDAVNTVINADGKRRCRTCINARARARRTAEV